MEKLEIGKTQIGTIEGKFNGIYDHFKIYYGNVAEPTVDGKVLHLDEEKYNVMLAQFIQDQKEKGIEYAVPSLKTVNEATKEMINREAEVNRAKNEELKKKQIEREEQALLRQETLKEKDFELRKQEIDAQKERNRIEQENVDTFKKKIKTLKVVNIILIILFTCLCAIGGLHVYKYKEATSEITSQVEAIRDSVINETQIIIDNAIEKQQQAAEWQSVDNFDNMLELIGFEFGAPDTIDDIEISSRKYNFEKGVIEVKYGDKVTVRKQSPTSTEVYDDDSEEYTSTGIFSNIGENTYSYKGKDGSTLNYVTWTVDDYLFTLVSESGVKYENFENDIVPILRQIH